MSHFALVEWIHFQYAPIECANLLPAATNNLILIPEALSLILAFRSPSIDECRTVLEKELKSMKTRNWRKQKGRKRDRETDDEPDNFYNERSVRPAPDTQEVLSDDVYREGQEIADGDEDEEEEEKSWEDEENREDEENGENEESAEDEEFLEYDGETDFEEEGLNLREEDLLPHWYYSFAPL